MVLNLFEGYAFIRTQIKKEIVYRFNFFVWSLVIPSWIIISYFLWKSVYAFSGQDLIRGMSFEALIGYYIASMIVGILADAGFDDWVAGKIRTGKLIQFMSYPTSLLHFLFFKWLAKKIMNLIIFIPPLLIIGYYLVGFILNNLSLALLSVALAMLLTFTFVMLFTLTAFWFKNIRGVRHLRQGLTWFLSGSIIPLNFFPIWFQNVSHYLPFQYMRYIPAQIMTGFEGITSMMVVYQFVWVVVMFGIVLVVWNKAYAQFTGVGV